jgi:ATP-dependent helicase/nuclease subunit B
LYHQLLDRLVSGALRAGKSWDGSSAPIDSQAIRACASDVARALRHELMLGSARNRYLLQRVEKTLAQFIESQQEFLKRGRLRPAFAALTYGLGGRLKELEIDTPGGARLRLHGKIDRVDVSPDSGDCAVFDYKLAAGTLRIDGAFWGISLQLLTSILALRAGGVAIAGRKLEPLGAFCLSLLRRMTDVRHPDEAPDADDPSRLLAIKPRGIFDVRGLGTLDREFAGGASEVVNVFVKKDGLLGRRNASDAAESGEFEALLSHVSNRLGELADRILSGDIDITPYRLNRQSPCPKCEFRTVCRFETTINQYRHLPALGREGVLVQLTQGGKEVGSD